MTPPYKAIFLDRDGVLNKEVNYLHKIEDFEFTPHCIEALQMLQKAGYKLFIVTNQAGIGRGYYTEGDFHHLMAWLEKKLYQYHITIEAIAFCPHHPTEALGSYKTDCECRKPAPGMLLDMIKKHNVDVAKSYMVGDKFSDLIAAEAADIAQCILVKTGHAFKASAVPSKWKIYESLYSFAKQLTQDN